MRRKNSCFCCVSTWIIVGQGGGSGIKSSLTWRFVINSACFDSPYVRSDLSCKLVIRLMKKKHKWQENRLLPFAIDFLPKACSSWSFLAAPENVLLYCVSLSRSLLILPTRFIFPPTFTHSRSSSPLDPFRNVLTKAKFSSITSAPARLSVARIFIGRLAEGRAVKR